MPLSLLNAFFFINYSQAMACSLKTPNQKYIAPSILLPEVLYSSWIMTH